MKVEVDAEKKQIKFVPNNLPQNKKFQLFNKNDMYLYDKKFYNTLPFDIIQPISFHLTIRPEKVCEFNKEVMLLGLNKITDILTDINMNTSIERSFMNYSLNVLYNRNLSESKQVHSDEFKKEILDIIDKDDNEEEKDNSRIKSSFYMRRTTLIAPPSGQQTNQLLSNNSLPKMKSTKSLTEGEENFKKLKFLENKIKSAIIESFNDVQLISEQKESIKHPSKPNLTIKNIYNLKPFAPMMTCKLSEIIFPTDPQEEQSVDIKKDFILIKHSSEGLNQLKSLPQTSLASDEKLFTLFKGDAQEEEAKLEEKIFFKKDFNYEREYAYKKNNQHDNFNQYLLFLSKNSNSAFYCPVDKKYQLKKFIQPLNEESVKDINGLLRKKREQKIILFSDNPSKEEIDDGNRRMEKYGLNYKMKYDAEFVKNKKKINEKYENKLRKSVEEEYLNEDDKVNNHEGDDYNEEKDEENYDDDELFN